MPSISYLCYVRFPFQYVSLSLSLSLVVWQFSQIGFPRTVYFVSRVMADIWYVKWLLLIAS